MNETIDEISTHGNTNSESSSNDDKSINTPNYTSDIPPVNDCTFAPSNDTKVDIPTQPSTVSVETITKVLENSTDEEIDKMNIAIAQSEYFRLSSDNYLTIEKILRFPPNVIYDDLKRFRN